MKGRCVFCKREIGKLETAAWPVRGWEIERQKGANGIYARKREAGKVAHETCLKSQASRGQGSLMAYEPESA